MGSSGRRAYKNHLPTPAQRLKGGQVLQSVCLQNPAILYKSKAFCCHHCHGPPQTLRELRLSPPLKNTRQEGLAATASPPPGHHPRNPGTSRWLSPPGPARLRGHSMSKGHSFRGSLPCTLLRSLSKSHTFCLMSLRSSGKVYILVNVWH